MKYLSYASRLVELASSGEHYGAKASPSDLHRLIAWVDAMGPYRGAEEIRDIADPEFEGIEDLAIRPRTESAPSIPRP